MIKPNKIKPAKIYPNLTSNLQPLTYDHKGITLIALIITIIIMLILAGVTINIAINGGLFDIAKQAVKQTEIEAYKEKIDAIRIYLLPEQITEGLDGKEYIDRFEEEIRKDSNFKESTITRKDELTLTVITKEGYEFEITEEETKYIGKGEGTVEKPEETKPEDLNESNTKFTYTPEGWTNGVVKVKIETETKGDTLEYSTDGVNWTNYLGEIEIEENAAIYARLKDSKGNVGGMATGNVTKIDTDVPEIIIGLSSPSKTTSSIDLSIKVKDNLSGFSKIEWYYKKNEDPESEYESNKKTEENTAMNGSTEGTKTEVTKETTISGLTARITYNIYAVVYDVAGNSSTSNTINVTTSHVGESATINGEKYIVLYDEGEQGENVQLISANVLEPGNICLGRYDNQIDWANTNVIKEADIDGDGNLIDVEKAIYSYNHVVETLNKKCERLVGNTNTDIVSVRSVGTNPTNPNSDTTSMYTSDTLQTNPLSDPGKYNEKSKNADTNYLTDFNRLSDIGIYVAENNQTYWVASRITKQIPGELDYFSVYYGNTNGKVSWSNVFRVARWDCTCYGGAGDGSGVRPVISLKTSALVKYLD